MQQDMWTDAHREMASRAGYSPDTEDARARADVHSLVKLYRSLGSDRHALDIVDRKLASRQPPPETDAQILREVRDLLKEVRDLMKDR